jgi:hypothetical protein
MLNLQNIYLIAGIACLNTTLLFALIGLGIWVLGKQSINNQEEPQS